MIIQTPEDYFIVAEKIKDDLRPYANEFGLDWDDARFHLAIMERDHATINYMCNQLWMDLPDHPSIRHKPFFDMCDLCSEIWVFEGDDTDAGN